MLGIENVIESSLNSLESMENGALALDIVFLMSYLESNLNRDMVLNYFSSVVDGIENVKNSLKLLEKCDLIFLSLYHGETVFLTFKMWQDVIREHIRRNGIEEEVLRKTLRMVKANLNEPNMLNHVISALGYAAKYESICGEYPELFLYINDGLKRMFTAGVLSYGEKVFSYSQSVLGECFSSILYLHIRLSEVLYIHGEPKDALEMLMSFYEKGTVVERDYFGEDLWFEASATIAMTLSDLSRSEEALSIFSNIFQNRDLSHESKRKILVAWHQYAILLKNTEQYTESLQVLKKLLKRQEEILDENNDDISLTKYTMALVYWKLKSFNEALEMHIQVLREKQMNFGPDHPDTIRIERNIALLYLESGDKERALILLTEVCMKMDVILGENHPETLVARANLALTLGDFSSQNEKALKIYQDLYKRQCITLGPKHVETLKVLENIAVTLMDSGKIKEGLDILQDVLNGYNEVLGEGNMESVRVKQNPFYEMMALQISNTTSNTISNDPNIFAVVKSGNFVKFKTLLQTIDNINCTNHQGKTLLHVASEYGHLNIAKALLGDGCIYDSKSKSKETPAQLAKFGKLKNLFQSVSSLFDAVKSGNTEVIINLSRTQKRLLNARDSNGCTLAHWAALRGNADILKMLLEKGLKPEVASKKGNTPLHIAAQKGRSDIIELILSCVTKEDRPAFINKRTTKGGNTAIHAAAQNGFNCAVIMLLKHGGSCNILNSDGKTPLEVTSDTKA